MDNSQGRRFGIKVSLIVLLFFTVLEVFTRTKLFKMSKDFVRFSSYARRAKTLSESNGMRIAFVGNSATERGLSMDAFQRELASRKPEWTIASDLFVADASKINTWQYMLESYFWRPSNHADLVIVSFYEHNLEDGNGIEIGRLAQFFTKKSDWPEVFRTDLTLGGDRIEFAVSSFWATYAARERTRERMLGAIIPHYKDFIQEMNSLAYAGPVSSPQTPLARTTVALDRFLADAKAHDTKLLFIAFPTRPEQAGTPPYNLNSEVLAKIESSGSLFLDMRSRGSQPLDRYADEIHLTPEGAQDYSRKLAAELSILPIGPTR